MDSKLTKASVRLQRLQLSDLSHLQTIGRATYEPYYRHIWHNGGVDWYMNACFGQSILERELQDYNIHYFFAFHDPTNTIIGLLKTHPSKAVLDDTTYTPAYYLEKIYLMPDFFGKGAGQVLLAIVEDMAIEYHRDQLWLQVMDTGPVRAYERYGFKIQSSTRFEYDLLKEELRNGWVMVKNL